MATPRQRGRPARRDRDEGASRTELLDAGMAVFAERGFAAASVEEIIRRAGLSKGTFYFNFTGKEDLFAAVVHERLDLPARELMQLTAGAPGDEPTAGAISRGLADLAARERTTLLLLQEYWAQAARDEELAVRYRTRQRALRDALAETLRLRHEHTGVPLTIDADRLATAFIALAQGLALESVVDEDSADDSLYGEILNLVYDGLVHRAEEAQD